MHRNFIESEVQSTSWQMTGLVNDVVIKVDNFSMSAKENNFFGNSNLLRIEGKYYGTVRPNYLIIFVT